MGVSSKKVYQFHLKDSRVTISGSRVESRFSTYTRKFLSVIDEYPLVTRLWIGIVTISLIVAGVATYSSSIFSRESVVNPLLVGIITLLTISLTITTLGIQLASDRYSHRVDSLVLQTLPIGVHFSPHLIAILVGVIVLSSDEYIWVVFFTFTFFSVAAILSIFPFLIWLLNSLTPFEVLTKSIGQINSDYLRKVEKIAQEERKAFVDHPRSAGNTVFEDVTYSQTTKNDPVDAISDIVRSSIKEEDTGTARRVLNEYVDRLEPIITSRYRDFKTSHSDSQLVCWYLYGPLEDIFRQALKNNNHVITIEVISLLRESIVSWQEDGRDVPEVFLRLFGRVTNDYVTNCDLSQRNTMASEYSSIARTIASDIRSPHTKINGASKSNFGRDCLNFALESVEQGDYRSARTISHGLRQMIEAQLRIPSSNPKRNLLSMGLIGEAFAIEDAKSKQIVAIAEEVSITDEAERIIVTLVTFLDKIDEYGNGCAGWPEYRELVVNEIDRINDAMESRNQDIAAQISENNSLVMRVLRASRFFRSSFTPKELLDEMNINEDVHKVTTICDALVDINAMTSSGTDEYKTTYNRI